MSRVSEVSAAVDRAVLASRQQLVLRGLLLAATAGFVWLVAAAGGSPGLLSVVALAVAAAAAATAPDSHAPMVLVLGLGWLWWGEVPDSWSTPSLVAAGLLLVVHGTATLGCYGPPALRLPGPLLRAWTGRGLVMLAATALVWLAAGLLTTLDLPQSAAVVVAAMALVAGWIGLLMVRLVGRDDT
jgi:hypothetical protein